jgi:hypothetical protein
LYQRKKKEKEEDKNNCYSFKEETKEKGGKIAHKKTKEKKPI